MNRKLSQTIRAVHVGRCQIPASHREKQQAANCCAKQQRADIRFDSRRAGRAFGIAGTRHPPLAPARRSGAHVDDERWED